MHKDIRACLPNQDALQYLQGLEFRCICVCIVDRINASAPKCNQQLTCSV